MKRPQTVLRSKKFIVASLVSISSLIAVPVFATTGQSSEGQIAGGRIYYVKDVTTGGSYANSINANACDTLEYKVLLYNPGPSFLQNVQLKANLPSTASTTLASSITASSVNAQPNSTSASNSVGLSTAQNESYVSGTTQLLNQNGGVLQNLNDGIASGGVSIGNLAASGTEWVQFQTKVSCPPQPTPTPTPTPPPAPTPKPRPTPATVCTGNTNNTNSGTASQGGNCSTNTTVTQSNNSGGSSSANTTTNSVNAPANGVNTEQSSAAAPTTLVNTGPGSLLAYFTGAAVVGTLMYQLYIRRLSQFQ